MMKKWRTICCCLVLLCANSGDCNLSAQRHQRHAKSHHPVYFDALNGNEGVAANEVHSQVNQMEYYDEEHEMEMSHKVHGRSSVNYQEEEEEEGNHLLPPPPPPQMDSKRTSEDFKLSPSAERNIEEFMEQFYVKSLRIEMQKSKILHAFPPGELPLSLLQARDNEAVEDSSENNVYASEEEFTDDQEMMDFVRNVSSSMEQQRTPPLTKSGSLHNELQTAEEVLEEPATDGGWLASFRPIYQFIKEHMGRFEKELNEHKRKVDRLLKQAQEEREANDDEDDAPYDLTDFENEDPQREIIFLDEVDCEQVFKGYYPATPRPPTQKDHLDFCLRIDRSKFKNMVDAKNTDRLSTNSLSDLPQLQIRKAELWFFKASPDAMDSHKQMFSLTSIDNWDLEGKYKKFETISLKQSPTAIGWIKADISKPILEWLSPLAFATRTRHTLPRDRSKANQIRKRHSHAYYNWKRNFGHLSKHKFFLNVSCKTCLGGSSSSTEQQQNLTESVDGSYRPFFLIDYKRIDGTKHHKKDRKESRSRRERRNLNCAATTKDCCRESLWIDFKENGMDFIIHPQGYHANFCRGDCSTAADNALRSSHNTVLNRYARSRPALARRLGIKTCCSATEYENLDVMYMNSNNAVNNQTMKNLIVKSCGCN